jgi:hypothetical protein
MVAPYVEIVTAALVTGTSMTCVTSMNRLALSPLIQLERLIQSLATHGSMVLAPPGSVAPENPKKRRESSTCAAAEVQVTPPPGGWMGSAVATLVFI